MALSVSNISLTFKKEQHSAFFSQNPITTPDLNRKWASLGISRSNNTTRMPEIPERRLADSWKEIHGQDDWVGMLDPMDPLLRSELVRYGEMAQACYDAFDSDPYSKYCGSCKTEPIKFFQYLGWTKYGYEVTRYLHASYNISLPFLFKKSLWPDGWTPSANWMGYVAVSNDDTSAYLGRRDITIAWRGTVTKLEWIADVTDLRSIALHKIPSPDPRVKAESGFIHVYTDKDINCKFMFGCL